MKTKFTIILFFLAISFLGYGQQPTNGSFDNFTNPVNPDGWTSLENLINSSNNIFTSQDLVDKVEGVSSLNLVSDSIPGLPQFGVAGGLVSLGTGVFGGNSVTWHGIPFTERPDTLVFDYKHSAANGPDDGKISIYLTANQLQILNYQMDLADQSNWTHVSIPLTGLYQNGLTPDTLRIEISCGGGPGQGVLGTSMNIDGLRFGYVPPSTGLSVYTMGRDHLGAYDFNLYGAINANGDSADYSFVYSTDPSFATSTTSTSVETRKIDSLQVVWATVNGLDANTNYYYFLTATTDAFGTANGDTMSFYSDSTAFLFANTGADVYGGTYAELNGRLEGFQTNADLSFEYGLTPTSLDSIGISNFPVVSDSLSHTFRGYLTTISPATLYFYRAKAVTGSETIYSDIRGFYTGIPYTVLQALTPTNITSTTAELHGNVQGFPVPVKVKSGIDGGTPEIHLHSPLEYFGFTTSLINYDYTATGLTANQTYGVRLKADTWIGSYYSDTSVTTLPTGIDEQANSTDNIFTYPNPATDILTIELKQALNSVSTIQLFSLNGQLVREYSLSAHQNRATIVVADLEAGFYLLRLVSENAVFNKELTIVK